jgi:ATP-dependent DNA helicase RecG
LLLAVRVADLENQKGVHQSRNSNVAKALREVGYMRELGEGIRRIFELMKSNDLEAPHFESKNKSFKVVLSQKHVFTKEEKLWLDNFDQLTLTREQKTVVRLGTNGKLFSTDDIWEACGIVDTDKYRQLLESMKELGILRRNFDRNKAYLIAKNTRTSKKEIKQFEIVIPSSFKRLSETKPEIKKAFKPNVVKPEIPLDDLTYSKIYVTNIPYDTNENELIDFFKQFGDVVSVKIPRHFQTKHIRGFAYIEYGNPSDAANAIDNSSKYELKGRLIYIQKSTYN